MIRPNTLSNRAEDSALARVEAIVERIDDTPVQRYAISGLSVPERATHARRPTAAAGATSSTMSAIGSRDG